MPARHALSQLSYGPFGLRQCSREPEILGPVHSETLIVSGGASPKLDMRTNPDPGERQVVTLVRVGAIGGEGIDLRGGIEALSQSFACAPT
jgi:hypothetical protein